MRHFKLVLLLLITTRCFAFLPYYERWQGSFEQAQEMAQKENRPLLIAFLGPQWCPYSDELEESLLTTNSFLGSLEDKVIFLRIDIPEDYDEDIQTTLLREKYHIDSCPTLILVEPNGQEIAKVQTPSAQDILDILDDYSQVSKAKALATLEEEQLKSLYTQAGKLADLTFKKALLEAGLRADQTPYFLLEQYGDQLAKHGVKNRVSKMMRNRIIARDLNNEKGCRRQLALMDFEALVESGDRLTARTVVKPLIDYLQKFGAQDPENAWQLELKISQYLFSRDRVKDALKHANVSLKIAPESQRREVAKSVEYLEKISAS